MFDIDGGHGIIQYLKEIRPDQIRLWGSIQGGRIAGLSLFGSRSWKIWIGADCLRMSYNMQPQILKRSGFPTVVCQPIAKNSPWKRNVTEDIGLSLIESPIGGYHLTTCRQPTTQLGCVTPAVWGIFNHQPTATVKMNSALKQYAARYNDSMAKLFSIRSRGFRGLWPHMLLVGQRLGWPIRWWPAYISLLAFYLGGKYLSAGQPQLRLRPKREAIIKHIVRMRYVD